MGSVDVKLNDASDIGIKSFVIVGNCAAKRNPVRQEHACLGLFNGVERFEATEMYS